MVCTVELREASGDFYPGLPTKGVKLWKFQPAGMPELVHPASNWVANNEDELAEFWFRRDGTDISAIQVMHHNGQLTTIYKEPSA